MENNAADENAQFYVRIRGKITGPFGVDRLKTLRKQGRLSQTFELSTDRRNWKSAKTLKSVFGDDRKKHARTKTAETHAIPLGVGDQPTSASSDGWYYEIEGQQLGPVSFDELRRVAESGRLQEEDFVWSAGYDEWRPAAGVLNLFATDRSARDSSRTPSATNKTSATVQQFTDVSSGLLWTSILNGIRQRFTAELLEETANALMRWGGYAMIGAMLVVPVFMSYVAVKMDSIRLLFSAAGVFLGLGVLKYVAQRMATAVHNLVQSSPSRLASPAFLDSAALLFLSSGVALASGLLLLAIQSDDFSYIVLALQTLIISGYAACIALQPKWLNIKCPSEASGGEEGIGVLSFFLKVLLRFSAVFFGVGTILSTAGIIGGALVYLLSSDVGVQLDGMSLAMESGGMLVVAALFPLLAYLWSVLFLIPLDVVNSVLQVPRKLDRISRPNSEGES